MKWMNENEVHFFYKSLNIKKLVIQFFRDCNYYGETNEASQILLHQQTNDT